MTSRPFILSLITASVLATATHNEFHNHLATAASGVGFFVITFATLVLDRPRNTR